MFGKTLPPSPPLTSQQMVKRRRTGFGGFMTPYALGAAARVAQRIGRSFTRTRTMTRRSIQAPPVTSEKDTAVRYRYKRMPRRKRKRWVRFLKGVNHVGLQMQPMQSYTKSITGAKIGVANSQLYDGFMCGAHRLSGNDELQQCFFDAYATSSTLDLLDKKLWFKSVNMDIQFSNSGQSPLIIDLYTIQVRSAAPTTASIGDQFTTTYNEQLTITAKDVNNPAVTPWQNSNFCTRYKILKKREILLGPDENSTHQLRCPQNFHIDGRRIIDYYSGTPGRTIGYFFMVRGTPETFLVGEERTTRLAPFDLAFAVQWTVNYGLPPTSKQQEAIRNNT